jgi:IS30 family transposase
MRSYICESCGEENVLDEPSWGGPRPGAGRPRKLPPELEQQIREKLKRGVTVVETQKWLRVHHQVQVSLPTIRAIGGRGKSASS